MEGDKYTPPTSMESAGESTAPPVSPFQALVGVFFNPRKTFESLAAKPSFLLPLILLILAQAAFALVVFHSGAVKSDAIAKMEAQGKPPEVVAAMEKFFDSPAAPVIGAVSALVVVAFIVLVNAALVFFVGNLMLGARLTFKHYLCTTIFSGVVALVDLVARAALILTKGTMDVRLGLGNLLGDDPGYLGRLLDTVTNPLILWATAVSAIGVSVFAKKSFGFGVMAVLPGFLLMALMSGMHG